MDTSAKTSQQLSVHWDKCQANLLSSFEKLFNSEQFVDVTLAVESEMIKCHKVVLSASSAYFEKILVDNPCPHPVIIMHGMKYWEVLALVHFMYRGEVNVEEENLELLFKSAEALQIRGLATDTTIIYDAVKLGKSLGIKDDSVSRVQSEGSEPVQSGQSSKITETQTIALQSDIINTKMSAKFKKACYRNILPSFKTTANPVTNVGIVRDTPLVQLCKSSENVMIKEEVAMEFVNTDDVPIAPSIEYGVLQGEEVSLEGTLSQIVASDPGPSSSLDAKGLTGNITESSRLYPEPERPVARFNHWPIRLKNRKRCAYCKKTSLKRKDVATSCIDCKVGLCLGMCFQKYHESLGVCGTIFFF